jgi:hypothetical protein
MLQIALKWSSGLEGWGRTWDEMGHGSMYMLYPVFVFPVWFDKSLFFDAYHINS